jgi:hypothetical protein
MDKSNVGAASNVNTFLQILQNSSNLKNSATSKQMSKNVCFTIKIFLIVFYNSEILKNPDLNAKTVNCYERSFGLFSATFGQIRLISGHHFFPAKNYFWGLFWVIWPKIRPSGNSERHYHIFSHIK